MFSELFISYSASAAVARIVCDADTDAFQDVTPFPIRNSSSLLPIPLETCR